jgi:hypothetical protein
MCKVSNVLWENMMMIHWTGVQKQINRAAMKIWVFAILCL